ncbi:sugar ABC transporter substrate-binding protein [Quadrisphaera sp. DSM 44207]|uniref:sugar ABC transporter substrate-binding protein n=1 Tax=Quadrisphaera sp. DSM 44207 TaxID=1881057 RepID=UPI0008904414|nr:sugar ABC transporter substrate-binding protein [Quadrisphaera sp. DSM 44207]SDQ61877.1 ribose transport system substrate-binding protein [Quadrisphaera sp. DSM 44207]
MSPRKSFRRAALGLTALTATGALLAGCGTTGGTGSGTAAVGAGGGAGCNEPTPPEDVLLVLSVINTTNPYMASMIQGAEALAEELGSELRIVDSQNSSQTEISQIQAILAEGKKVAMIVNTVASSDAVPIVNAVGQAGGCVVIWWNKPDDFEPKEVGDHFVAFQMHSGVDAGRCNGKLLAESLGGQGSIVAFPGVLDSTVSQQRVAGMKDALKEYPGITILEERPANWDQAIALKEAQSLIAKHGDAIDGVWTADDAMLLGALEAFNKAGMTEEVDFVGEGLYPPVVDIMQNGGDHIVGETFHRGYMAAPIGLYTAYLAATGEMQVSEMTDEQRNGLFEIQCVTPQNYTEFLTYDQDVPGWIDTLIENGPFDTEPVPLVGGGPVELPQ